MRIGTFLAWSGLVLAGCMGADTSSPGADGDPPLHAIAPTPGPVAQAPIGVIPAGAAAFPITSLSEHAASLVTAMTPDLALYYAYVDLETAWPVVGRAAGGGAVALPGERARTHAVAMLGSADGSVHLLWDAGGLIRHVRLHPGGRFDAPQILSQAGSRDPNAAIGPGGELAVAWTRDAAPDAEGERRPAEIVVTRGVLAGDALSFEPSRIASTGCCRNEGGGASENTSGPSVAVAPNGDIHVVWEWSTFSNTTIEHRTEADGFTRSVVISDAAFSPCPALLVDEDGAHISYLVENWDNRVLYKRVVDGEIVEERALYTPERGLPRLALMRRDSAGVFHLGVVERVDGDDRIIYVRGEEGATVHVVAESERPAQLHLTPRAGGGLLAPDGKLILSYQRAMPDDGPRYAEFAMIR